MDLTQYYQYVEYIGYLVLMVGALYILYLRSKVQKSVGWNFIESLAGVKFSKGKDLVLRIKSPTGKEVYQKVNQAAIIKYNWQEKGKTVEKKVLYDQKAVDYLNGIPILNVTPTDIRPLDRNLGTLVNIPTEVIEKLIVDSTKSFEADNKKDKTIKTLTWTVIAMAVLLIVGLSYINQTNTEVQAELLKCTLRLGEQATVIAN